LKEIQRVKLVVFSSLHFRMKDHDHLQKKKRFDIFVYVIYRLFTIFEIWWCKNLIFINNFFNVHPMLINIYLCSKVVKNETEKNLYMKLSSHYILLSILYYIITFSTELKIPLLILFYSFFSKNKETFNLMLYLRKNSILPPQNYSAGGINNKNVFCT